ncbi:hypothetical protein DM02DRAFT_673337 [Periconia macrospinosa]|uniref:Uncharacterized protein n=1 Tax=Periconia macrospinosa TaxID=97972 RepID=A0A2V1DK31_9PLEO|nr:hypothetical protein DM02DRAFT_673337 [Periconia macrospinosa]
MPSSIASAVFLALSTLTLASPLSSRAVPIRTGKVFLHHSIEGQGLALGSKVGCLDVNGRLILESSACASYTTPTQAIAIASTNAGECGFHFADEPKNPDAPSWSAFRCKSEGTGSHDYPDQFALLESGGNTYVVTAAGSGANWGVFTKSLPKGNGDAVDVFTRAFNLGEGSIDMLWIFKDV